MPELQIPISSAPKSLLEKHGLSGSDEGIFLRVPAGLDLQGEIKMRFTKSESQNLILLGKNSSAKISFESGGLDSYHEKTVVVLEQGSSLYFSAFELLKPSAQSKISRTFTVSDSAKLTRLEGCFGGKNVHVQTNCTIGKFSECSLSQVSLLSSGGIYKEETGGTIASPSGKFYLESRNVAHGTSKSNCLINARIEHGATESDMAIRAKILKDGPDCTAEAKPVLEVYTNDVIAAHGAVVKEIDEGELFYLQSRGISRESSKRIIMKGFLGELMGDYKTLLAGAF